MVEVDRHPEREPRVAAVPEGRARPPRDVLPLAVETKTVDQRDGDPRAWHQAIPVVAIGVGGAERHLQPRGAERSNQQLRRPEPRQRRAEGVRVRLPHVLDGRAERDVAADPRREAEVERVGAGEGAVPEVRPGDAEGGVAQEVERIGELQRRVRVDPRRRWRR